MRFKGTAIGKMKKLLYTSLCLFFFSAAHASDNSILFPSKRVYVGVNVGGGYTTWEYMVDTQDPAPDPIDPSTPTDVKEGGPSWGVVFGFDVSRNFALELQYMQFADSHITFDSFGAASYNLSSNTIISKTDAYSLSGKFFVPVGVNTRLRVFAAVGAGTVERHDVINNTSCITPYLSAGADYHFSPHWILESGFQYYTGFGASQLFPVNNFIPFAWDGYARLAYQF